MIINRGAYASHDTTPGQARADIVEVEGYLEKHPDCSANDVSMECHMDQNHAMRLVDYVNKHRKINHHKSTQQSKILDSLASGPKRCTELEKELGIKKTAMRMSMWRLQKRGLVEKVRPCRWQVAGGKA